MAEQLDILNKFDELTKQGRQQLNLIIEKAAVVFSEKGYHASSLADVSRATGISKGGLYHYFATKEDILFGILSRYMDMFLEGLEEELQAIPSPAEKIRFFIYRHIRYYSKWVPESRLQHHEVKHLPPKYWAIMRIKHKEYYRILKEAVEGYLEEKQGDKSPERVKITTYSILGMVNWTYWWYDPNGPIAPEELAEKIFLNFIGRY